MSKTMLINVTHVEESRVAILEDGVLATYEIETINRTSIKGNIYNSVVESVHPALEAAFVRISPDLKGFLPLDEINYKLLPQRREDRNQGKIGQHLQQGQRLITQVVREPFAGKPPSVSTYFSLPGRYLVLMPGVDTGGISRKIEDSKQRDELKQMIDELNPPEGFGLIVRTAGIGQTKTELQRDLRYLLRLWESIQKGSGSADFPGLVYQERDLVIRTIRDHLTPDITEVCIDSEDTYGRALEFVKDVMPTKGKLLTLYKGDRPLFNKYNLEEQIERIYKRRVPLPSGGEIVIDGTEALTAIDVNSARSSKKADAEDNATKTNLEAAVEIARQLRLRDLGGLIVIDFIDMMKKGNIKKVETEIKNAMRGDKARHDITRISKLGLMEIARQRIKGAKLGASYETCTNCDGFGMVKNIEPAALSALRKLQTRAARGGFGSLTLTLPLEVADWILNHKREELLHLERRHDIRIVVDSDATMRRHENRFETRPRVAGEPGPGPSAEDRSQAPTPADVALAERAARDAASGETGDDGPPSEDEPATGPRKRRRRRRRRGGPGAAQDAADGVHPDDDDDDHDAEAAKDLGVEDVGGEIRTDEADHEDTDDGTGTGEEPAAGPRKRRRRRRRRGSAASTPDAGEATETDEAGENSDGGRNGEGDTVAASARDADVDDERREPDSAETVEDEDDHAADPATSEDGDDAPKRRRRRRRRRGRGGRGPGEGDADGDDAGTDTGGSSNAADGDDREPAEGDTSDGERDDDEIPAVPPTVRADELMPAAAGDPTGGPRRRGTRRRPGR